jgi:hypothetical protein
MRRFLRILGWVWAFWWGVNMQASIRQGNVEGFVISVVVVAITLALLLYTRKKA